ncbi:hypothetical protein ACFL9T_05810 [Thermodesulfobacteriota bacterium]
MKPHILSTLCSAFVIPGLGQILNKNIKKGLLLLALVFLLFLGGAVKLVLIVLTLPDQQKLDPSRELKIANSFEGADLSLLWYLLSAFVILWIYSVTDAYLTGKKMERQAGS